MAKHNGPISEGVKRAIKASDKTPYAIAKEVRKNTKDKINLTPAQLYKFLAGDVGLSLAVLDEIAAVLDLVVQKRGAVEESPAPVGPQAIDPKYTGQALRDKIKAMKKSLRGKRRDPFADDEETSPAPPAPPQNDPEPEEKDPDHNDFDDYEASTGSFARSRTIRDVNAREVAEKMQILAPMIKNPGMRAIADRYAGPGRSVNAMEKAKFVNFVSQMLSHNPHASEIMEMPDLADRFHEIARIVPDPANMGRIGKVISQAGLWPACEDPERFKADMHKILSDQGVGNGIVEPRKGPKPPGSR